MWYDKRWMRIWFYVGVMCVAVGFGITRVDPAYKLAGVILMCIGAALIVFGYTGMKMNVMAEQRFRRRRV